METDALETLTFEQSPALMGMFGSLAAFETLVAEETTALASSNGIIDFLSNKALELAQGAGGAALRWASAQLLRAIGLGGGPSELERIAAMLDQIVAQQKLIMAQLDALGTLVQYEHLVTRAYPSISQITTLHKQLRRLAAVRSEDEDEAEDGLEEERLRRAILDGNNGTIASLDSLNRLLLGRDRQSESLIRTFSARWQTRFLERQLRPDTPLSTYWRGLDDWLHDLFIIQYQGLAQLANARMANGTVRILQREIADAVENMKAQRAMLNEAIPEWTRTLPDQVTDGRWHVVRAPHMRNGRRNTAYALHGGGTPGHVQSTQLSFLDRHASIFNHLPMPWNDRFRMSDEHWRFERSGPNDGFVMRLRTWERFVAPHRGRMTVQPQGALLRLVLVPTRGREGWGPEPFVPGLAMVGGDRYLFWRPNESANSDVLAGTLDEASIIEIEPIPW